MNKTMLAVGVGILSSIVTHIALKQIDPIVVATLPNGGMYSGDLENGRLEGQGQIEWANGALFKGEFNNGLFSGKGRMEFASGAIYDGEFNQGLMHGYGQWQSVNGTIYRGEFKDGRMNGSAYWRGRESSYQGDFRNGRFHGQGTLEYDNGNRYVGEFRNGQFHGQGLYTNSDGAAYSGEFIGGKFTGEGSFTDEMAGTQYVGDFLDWKFHGDGIFTTDNAEQYKGEFESGELSGKGEFTSETGDHYVGEFKNWIYDGQGKLTNSDGDIFEGGFSYGLFHGEGTLKFDRALDNVAEIEGRWKRGVLIDSSQEALVYNKAEVVEWLLYEQANLMNQQIENIAENNPDKQELYFVGIGGDGSQEVFRREIKYVQSVMMDRFTDQAHTVLLSNSRRTYKDYPIATNESVRRTLTALAEKMDRDKDILFLFLTSHGTANHDFYLNQLGLSIKDLAAETLGEIIKGLDIKNKVIVVSACYSGGFIPHLEDEQSIIITAAREDRTSFGCSDRRDFTYFGQAYFKEGLAAGMSFLEAFEHAKERVAEWESQNEYEPSEPQISAANTTAELMDQWSQSRTGEVLNTPKDLDTEI